MAVDVATIAFTVKSIRQLADRAKSLGHDVLWLCRRKNGASICFPDLTECVPSDAIETNLAVLLLPLNDEELVDTISLRGFIVKKMTGMDDAWRLLVQFNQDNEFRMLLRAAWRYGQEDKPPPARIVRKKSRPASAWMDIRGMLGMR